MGRHSAVLCSFTTRVPCFLSLIGLWMVHLGFFRPIADFLPSLQPSHSFCVFVSFTFLKMWSWGSIFLSVHFSGNLTMFLINSLIIWLQDIFLYINCDSTEWMISLLAWSSLLSMPPRKMLCIKLWKNSFWSRRIYIQPFPLHTHIHVCFPCIVDHQPLHLSYSSYCPMEGGHSGCWGTCLLGMWPECNHYTA